MPRKTSLGKPASNKQAEILAAALRHFAAAGVDGTSMNDLAEAVGIRKATLYHYYPGKDVLIEALFTSSNFKADRLRAVMADRGVPLEERLLHLATQYLEVMRERPDWQALMLREARSGSNRPWAAKLNRLLRRHIQGRIDALAAALCAEAPGLTANRAELLAAQFFHALTGFWIYERHICGVAPPRRRCDAFAALQVKALLAALPSPVGSPAIQVRSS